MASIVPLRSNDALPSGAVKSGLGFEATVPGMSCTTLNVPSVQDRDGWNSFLHMMSIADGMVVLRPSDSAEYDSEGYLANSHLLPELLEITDSRPMFIVCVCKGPLRSSMMMLPAVSQIVLATSDATFGFPEFQAESVHGVVAISMERRVTKQVCRRMMLVGDTVTATEAQRFGLVDFVGTDDEAVENEVCRLIYRNCRPTAQTLVYNTDLLAAMQEQEKDRVEEA